MIAIKVGVLFGNLTPQMVLGHTIVASIFAKMIMTCTITSGSDGQHMEGSLHAHGDALDYRTNELTDSQAQFLLTNCKSALGENFDVVLESDHLHVEYDPKASETAVA